MSRFTADIQDFRRQWEYKQKLNQQIDEAAMKMQEMDEDLADMLEASSLLSAVSDNNTNTVLNFITGVINKALAEIFPYDTRRVFLEHKTHAGQYPHIIVGLETGDGIRRSLTLQSGTGLRQIVSHLFNISLLEVRKSRRLLIMDELLSGLHAESKKIIMDLMQIFAKQGFQFVMVEYGVDDVGKIYLVEKPNETSSVTPLDGKYEGQIFEFNPPKIDEAAYESIEGTIAGTKQQVEMATRAVEPEQI